MRDLDSGVIDQEISLASQALISGRAAGRMRQEYEAARELFAMQPGPVRFFLCSQAQILADALVQSPNRVCFYLPSWIVCEPGSRV